jgi:hypothetical protein
MYSTFEELAEEFADRVHATYVENDWKWINHETNTMEVPTKEQITLQVIWLLDLVEHKGAPNASTGRIVVTRVEEEGWTTYDVMLAGSRRYVVK